MRVPIEYNFSERQSLLMGQSVIKTVGKTIRGPMNIQSAQAMFDCGLVELIPISKGPAGFIMKPTKKGREAWHNHGLKAAKRPPVCL